MIHPAEHMTFQAPLSDVCTTFHIVNKMGSRENYVMPRSTTQEPQYVESMLV